MPLFASHAQLNGFVVVKAEQLFPRRQGNVLDQATSLLTFVTSRFSAVDIQPFVESSTVVIPSLVAIRVVVCAVVGSIEIAANHRDEILD